MKNDNTKIMITIITFIVGTIFLILFICGGCAKSTLINDDKNIEIKVFNDTIVDTVYIAPDTIRIVALENINKNLEKENDSLQIVMDSLQGVLFVKNYKLQRIQRYCDIVKSKPSNQKYLRGWILRALKE